MEILYHLVYVFNFLLCVLLMKTLSWIVTSPAQKPPIFSFLFGWPYVSVRSLRIRPLGSTSSPVLSLLLYGTLMGVIFTFVGHFLSPITYVDRILLGPGIYFFTEAIGAFGQILFSWRNEEIFPIHHRPLSSPSLSEFWGRRWNLWVQDWIADMGRPFRRSHKTKILASFLFSGIFHEAMVNLPHWLISGESYFGTMLAYFIIQGAGLYLDKKIFRHRGPFLRRLWCWLVVVLPAPLFINAPLLRFFGVTE